MPDPLDALRTPIVPLAPDSAFAAKLRQRLELELAHPAEHPGQPAEHSGEEESDMTEILRRNRLSRNGTRHGDVSYITLALPDGAAGRRFYSRVLGWSFGAGREEHEANRVDDVIPEIGLWPASAWRDTVTAGAILSWRVDDIAAAVEAVRAADGTATDPEQQPYGLQSACSDGRGLRFWLHQLPAASEPAGPNGERHGDVSYVVLRVVDLEHAQRFFSSVLGWTFTPGPAGVHVGGTAPMTGMSEGSPGAVLCYRVDDVAAAVERVAMAGGRAGDVAARPYGAESLCADDQGIEFYLHQLS